jgi:hypothetical protein
LQQIEELRRAKRQCRLHGLLHVAKDSEAIGGFGEAAQVAQCGELAQRRAHARRGDEACKGRFDVLLLRLSHSFTIELSVQS